MKKFFLKRDANIFNINCAEFVKTINGVVDVVKNPTGTDDDLDLTQP